MKPPLKPRDEASLNSAHGRVLSHSGPVWSMETGVWQQSKKPRSGISWMRWNCPPGVSLPGRGGAGDQRWFEKKKFFLKTKNINQTLLK